MLRPEGGARAHITWVRFRTGDRQYGWLDTTTGLLEAALDTVGVGGLVQRAPVRVPAHPP